MIEQNTSQLPDEQKNSQEQDIKQDPFIEVNSKEKIKESGSAVVAKKSVWTEVTNQTLDQLKERSKERQSKLPGNSGEDSK